MWLQIPMKSSELCSMDPGLQPDIYSTSSTWTAFQFGCETVLVLLMCALRLHPTPKLGRSQANHLTNISIAQVAVSFISTVKAMEPFFALLLASLFLGETPTIWIVPSLVPVVGGVALASFIWYIRN